MTFTAEVYEQIREGARRSAAVIVPIVHDLFEPTYVIDVGCGEGWFAREFARGGGCEVTAIDETAEDDTYECGGRVHFRRADLAGDWTVLAPDDCDLAVCLEVAEHLPETSSDALVAALCRIAPIVLFSAAIPGQGGHGHLNEQWPSYWVERFERHGFEVSGALRWTLWGMPDVEPWYKQNLLVAASRERVRSDVALNYGMSEMFGEHAFEDPVPLVHPTIWEHRRQR